MISPDRNDCDTFDFLPHGEKDHSPIFVCSRCHSEHTAFRVWRGEDHPERDELRQAWLKACERANDDSLRPEQQKAAALKELETCREYMNTIKWAGWSVPDTVSTIRTREGYRLLCNECRLAWNQE